MSFLFLGSFRLKDTFYSFSWFDCFGKIWGVHDNACFFSLPDTDSVRQFLLKFHFCSFFSFLYGHLIYRALGQFHLAFFLFLFLFQQHTKTKTEKNYFLFENLIFVIPTIFRKHYFGTIDAMCVLKHTPNHFKNRGKLKNVDLLKLVAWTSFQHINPQILDQFLTLRHRCVWWRVISKVRV